MSESLLLRKKPVADEPIGPEIRHRNFEQVIVRLDDSGNVGPKRSLP